MEDRKVADDPTPASKPASAGESDILRRPIPRPLVFGLVIALPLVGFLVGSIGALGGGGTTISVDTTVTPNDIGLKPGNSGSVTVLVKNPTDEGMRVATIEPSESQAIEGCPAGALTSAELSNPAGYLGPDKVTAYPLTVTLQENAADACLKQGLVLPLTVDLASARD